MSEQIQHPGVQRLESLESLPQVVQEADEDLDRGVGLPVLLEPAGVADGGVGGLENDMRICDNLIL